MSLASASSPLWVDKYRPQALDELSFHADANASLKSLAHCEDLPHIMLVGPNGAGKMTRIRALLHELFGAGIYKMRIDEKVFQTPSMRKIELTIFSSNFHVEVNPSDVGIYDRVVVQEIIKELAQTQQIDKSKHSFKVAVVLEADRMSKDAQHALRRTMEKYSTNLRVIMCCSSASKIIGPIRSRCLNIRIPAPSRQDMVQTLQSIAQSENAAVSDPLIQSVVNVSEGNVRRALLALEAAIAKKSNVAGKPDWESAIDAISVQIFKEQTPNSLLAVRSMFYDLLVHAIPANLIFKHLLFALLPHTMDQSIATKIMEACAFYELRASKGSKSIVHLEAFAAKTMSIIAEGSLSRAH